MLHRPPRKGSSPVFYWHPEVHAHFKEALYYFFLSIKPENFKWLDQLTGLLSQHGVARFCAYPIFGTYDILLRLWLPPHLLQKFLQDIDEHVSNLHSLAHFQTIRILQCYGFFDYPYTDPAQLALALSELTPDSILAAQSAEKEEALLKLRKRGLLRIKSPAEFARNRGLIRAFITISEPRGNLPTNERKRIIAEFAARLNNRQKFSRTTLIEGTGCGWLLAKLVTKDFYHIGGLVHAMVREFAGAGISSSTFLLTQQDDLTEGEVVCTEALREFEQGNRFVADFLPALYTPGINDSKTLDRGGIEQFIAEMLANWKPADVADPTAALDRQHDTTAIHDFFSAVVHNDRDKTLTALFPRFLRAETVLKPSLRIIKCCPRSVEGLLHELQRYDVEGPKRKLNNLSILDLLRTAPWIFSHFRPNDPWVREFLLESTFAEIADKRNLVAHGRDFSPRKDWLPLATAVLTLSRIREGIVMRYQEIVQSLPEHE